MLSGILKLELKEAARKIKVPTYVVYGKYDAFITKAEINDMAKAIPHAEIIISKNQDHFVGTNSQDETSEIVLNFLNTQEGNTHP